VINPIKPNIRLRISLYVNQRYHSLETPKRHCRCNHTRVFATGLGGARTMVFGQVVHFCQIFLELENSVETVYKSHC